jgi:phage N-6-adenine-methyltransferase
VLGRDALARRRGSGDGVTIAGFRATNHPQQTARRGATDEVDDRGTTPEMFDPLHERFRFTLDVAASDTNAKCDRYFTRADDGLAQSWAGERVWCNPPYSDLGAWVQKAWDEHLWSPLIVMLVPANRTEQAWWQDLVEPSRDRPDEKDLSFRVEFLRGRPRFIRPDAVIGPKGDRPPFGCCLLIWSHR